MRGGVGVSARTAVAIMAGADAGAVKPALGVIFLGHVDSGKSTLIGHLMLKLGAVDQKLVSLCFHHWTDFGYFTLFIVFTVELFYESE